MNCPHNKPWGTCGSAIACSELAAVAKILQEWQDKQGHERCWYYPDLFRQLCAVLRVTPKNDPELPTRPEFEDGCRRYQDEQFKK